MSELIKMGCDHCHKHDECRFQYLQLKDDLPMNFCSYVCLKCFVDWQMVEYRRTLRRSPLERDRSTA
jgi:hypothetical protein